MNNLKNKMVFVFNRSIIIYLIAGLCLFKFIDHKRVVFKTMDHLVGDIELLYGCAKGQNNCHHLRMVRARRYYENLLKVMPDEKIIYNLIGFCDYKLNKIDKAISDYLITVSQVDDLFGLYYNLGVLYKIKQNDQKSLEYFKKAIKTDPRKTLLFFNSVGPYGFSEITGSKDSLNVRSTALAVAYQEVFRQIILINYKLGNYDEMFQHALIAIQGKTAESNQFYFYAANAAFNNNDCQKAISFLIEFIKINPDNLMAYELLNKCSKKLGIKELEALSNGKIKYMKDNDIESEDLLDLKIKEDSLFFYLINGQQLYKESQQRKLNNI